jgi:hypothetical protein
MSKVRLGTIFAVCAGCALRLFFVLKFPVPDSGDAPLYIELAWNWLKKGVYGFTVNGHLTPVDLRAPGYPAFLASVFLFAGRSTRVVLLAQIVIDVGTCFLIALIAAKLAPKASRRRVAMAGLWLGALCPFTANYTAVLLTETLVTFLTALAMVVLLDTGLGNSKIEARHAFSSPWFLGGLVVGFGTLVRPETPLLAIAAGLVAATQWWHRRDWTKLARAYGLMGLGLFLPLTPWAARNLVALHDVQFLAPRYSLLPDEFAPLGFNEWNNTWLWRFRDVYLVTWKLEVEPMSVSDLPDSAFDSPQERDRVETVFRDYNQTLTWTRDEDAALGRIARERTARHPIRTYAEVPFLRTLAMWFTPRVELLPYSGHLWPVRELWQDDRKDFEVTLGLVLTNCVLLGLAIAGTWIARESRGLAFLLAFIFLRTAFFTIFGEAPEPRYILECFPAVLAIAAQVFGGRQLSSTGSG